MKRVNARLTDAEYQQLEELAAHGGADISATIRSLIATRAAQQQFAGELFAKLDQVTAALAQLSGRLVALESSTRAPAGDPPTDAVRAELAALREGLPAIYRRSLIAAATAEALVDAHPQRESLRTAAKKRAADWHTRDFPPPTEPTKP